MAGSLKSMSRWREERLENGESTDPFAQSAGNDRDQNVRGRPGPVHAMRDPQLGYMKHCEEVRLSGVDALTLSGVWAQRVKR
jgi:hypothetical protein